MKTRTILLGIMLFPLLCAVAIPARAQTADPQQTLNQYVADLQSNPGDTALREKIIALVQTMSPAPAIPEEARAHYVMAQAFTEKATESSGFARAIDEYKAALLAAPWWAEAYEKLAIVQKAAHQYDDAIASLNLYLLTHPADARDAQDEIYKLKAYKQAAAEEQVKRQQEEQQRAWESSPAGIAAKRQKKQQELLARLNGARFLCGAWEIDVQGNKLNYGVHSANGWVHMGPGELTLDGLEASWPGQCLYAPGLERDYTYKVKISDDGSSLDLWGGGGACNQIWTYKLNDIHCDIKCAGGRRLSGNGNEYCP